MRNFFKKTGRSIDLGKSLSVPSEQNNEQYGNGRTMDGSAASDSDTLREAEKYCDLQNATFWCRRKDLSRPIMRIVSNKEFLSYFVQFLETKSALALIKFWIDADSFKTSAELCTTASPPERWRSPIYRRPLSANSIRSDASPRRRVLSKSVSLNIGALEHSEPDDALSLGAYSELLDSELNHAEDEPSTQRDVGDGSSQTNSMTNVSDICDYAGTEFRTKGCGRESAEDDEGIDGNVKVLGMQRDHVAEGKSDNTPIKRRNIHSDLVSDAKRIFHKYLVGHAAPYRVEMPAAILSEITTGLGRMIDESVGIASIFVEAQQYALNQLENDYVDAFLESNFYHVYCVEVLNSASVHISDILYNEAALFYFMEFVEQENQRTYFDFWISAVNFQRQLATETYDVRQAQSDALVLYEKFFSLQATQPMHLSDRIRFNVEERICSENGQIDDCFDLPLAVVERYFEERYLQPFIKSSLFMRFLTELRQKTDGHAITVTNGDTVDSQNRIRHRKTNSDCTGERVRSAVRHSISSQNTLLAMDGSRKRRTANASVVRGPPIDSNMLIDSKQLHDPDLLWRRNTIPGLSFGRIDELGRYERNYEPAPIGGSVDMGGSLAASSKFKQAVRKLVNLREESVQQEIAWQVAEMIVKEITSVTLNGNTTGKESQL